MSVSGGCFNQHKQSVDPDEVQHSAAFHLGLHCLPKSPFRGFQYAVYKGYKSADFDKVVIYLL